MFPASIIALGATPIIPRIKASHLGGVVRRSLTNPYHGLRFVRASWMGLIAPSFQTMLQGGRWCYQCCFTGVNLIKQTKECPYLFLVAGFNIFASQ